MIIIAKFNITITEYTKLGKNNFFPSIHSCKNCSHSGKLHRHGFYQRSVITPNSVFDVVILRCKCPLCSKTYSVIPDFLIPYFGYSFKLIISSLIMMFHKNLSYSNIISLLRKINQSNYISFPSLSQFRKRFLKYIPPDK